MSRCFQSDSVGLRSAGNHTRLAKTFPDTASAGRELRIMQILVTGASGRLGAAPSGRAGRTWPCGRRLERNGGRRLSGDSAPPGGAARPARRCSGARGGESGRGDSRRCDQLCRGGAPATRPSPGASTCGPRKCSASGPVSTLAGFCSLPPTWSLTARDLLPRGRPGGSGAGVRPDQGRRRGRGAGEWPRARRPAEHALWPGDFSIEPASSTRRWLIFARARRRLSSTTSFARRWTMCTAARLLIRLAVGDATGIIHAGGPERLSRFELMRRAATALGAEAGLVRANRRADVPTLEPRPADLSLDTSRLRARFPDLVLPTVEQALARET